MTTQVTEIQMIGEEDDIWAFLEQLEDADGDLALLNYRAAFDAWGSSRHGVDHDWIEAVAGPPVIPTMVDEPETEAYKHLMSLSLKMSYDRFLFKEAVCLAKLFELEVLAWFRDPAARRRSHLSLERPGMY
jgi:hypothetical protein